MKNEKKEKYKNQIKKETLKKIVQDYDENKIPVKEIIAKYSLDISPNGLSKILPPKKTDIICPYCSVPMYVERKRTGKNNTVKCLQCQHIQYQSQSLFGVFHCVCDNCTEKEEKEKNRIIEAIDNLAQSTPKVSMENVLIEDLVELFYLDYYDYLFDEYSGRSKKIMQKIQKYYDNNLLIISSNSSWENFEIQNDKILYDAREMVYEVNLAEQSVCEAFKQKIFPIELFANKQKKDLYKKIIIKLLVENVKTKMRERGRDFNPTQKSIERYAEEMCNLSYTQVEYLNYKTVVWAVDYYTIKGYNRKTLEQTILNFICDTKSRYVKNGWEIHKSNPYYVNERVRCFIEIVMQEQLEILNKPINEAYIES